MASAKQIAWRKKFARMSKAGKFKKSKKSSSTPKKSNPHAEKNKDYFKDAWKGLRKNYPMTRTPPDLVEELMKDMSKDHKGSFWRGSQRISFYVKKNDPREDVIVVSSEHGTRGDGYFYINKRNMSQAVFD